MSSRKLSFALTGVSILLATLVLSACSNNSHSYRFLTENDSYHPVDRPDANYTSGLLFMASPAKEYIKGDSSRVDRFNVFQRKDDGNKNVPITIEYGIGQVFYTPDDIAVDTLAGVDRNNRILSEDRPYAGLLFFQGAIHNHYLGDDESFGAQDMRRSVTAKIGLTGKGSFSEELHTSVHKSRDLIVPVGWGMQVGQEIAFTFGLEQHNRLLAWKYKLAGADVLSNIKASVGNIYTGLDAGVTLRAGLNLPRSVHQSSIHEAIEDPFGGTTVKPKVKRPSWHAYGFIGHQNRLVLRDFSLDGGLFGDEVHTVDREPSVNEAQIGWQVRFLDNWVVQALYAQRSKQFKSQRKAHSFGQYMIMYQRPFDD